MKKEEKSLSKLLRKYGYGIPQTEGEVEAFEKLWHSNFEFPPNDISAEELLKSRNKSKFIMGKPEVENQATKFLAMAAREGKDISDAVKKKMKQDRENARKK